MDAEAFTFEAETHTYRLGERVLPGITSIMEAAGLVDYSRVPVDVLAAAQERGKAVHAAAQYYDTNTLDYATLDPRIYPYLQAWIQFRNDFFFIPSFIEQPLHNGKYAGTPDRAGKIQWEGKPRLAVVEIKTTVPGDDAPGVQLAAQDMLLFHNYIWHAYQEQACYRKSVLRIAVHLADTGKYRMEHHDNPNDIAVFQAALTLVNYKARGK